MEQDKQAEAPTTYAGSRGADTADTADTANTADTDTTADRLLEAVAEALADAEILALAHHVRAVRESERRAAPALGATLESQPEGRARMAIDNRLSHQTWGLAERLMERSQELIYAVDKNGAQRVARLALAVAERLDTQLYCSALVADLRARARVALANACRCGGRFAVARQALIDAEALLLDGTGDPLEEAHLHSIHASIELDMGRYEEALTVLDRAIDIYDVVDDPLLLSKVLSKKAAIQVQLDPLAGAETSRRAMALADADAEPRLHLYARHNLIWSLNDAGEADQALRLLEDSRGLYRDVGGDWVVLRQGWLEARIWCNLGRHREATAAFEVLFDEYVARDYDFDAVMVTLDWAAARLALGDSRGARELANTTAILMREWEAHEHARDAWALFQKALASETATTGFIRDLAAYFHRAWRNPRLPFDLARSGQDER